MHTADSPCMRTTREIDTSSKCHVQMDTCVICTSTGGEHAMWCTYRMTEHNHCRDCSSPMRSTGWCYRARPHCEASFTVVYVHRQLARASSNQMRCFRARILTFLLHYLYLLHCFGVSVALLVEMDDSPCSVLVTR